jgi:hypothetical protein
VAGIDELPRPNGSRAPIVLFAPEEEYHEIPLLVIEYLLRKRGHRVVNLGANTPEEAVEDYCNRRPFSHLHYHQVTNFTRYDADELLEKWCLRYPAKRIVASGRPTLEVSDPSPNAKLLKKLDDLWEYASNPFAGGK